MKIPLAARDGCDRSFWIFVSRCLNYEFIGHSGHGFAVFVGLCEWICHIFFVNEFMSWMLSLFYLNETFTPHDVARSVMYVESTRGR